MRVTKREFEVISLYSRGLTFKEMGFCLNIATRTAINYYMRVKSKDKSRISRAKKSRAINKQSYIMQLKEVIQDARKYNNEIMRYGYTFRTEISIKNQSKVYKLNYFNECLLLTHRSWYKLMLKNARVSRKKVNTQVAI